MLTVVATALVAIAGTAAAPAWTPPGQPRPVVEIAQAATYADLTEVVVHAGGFAALQRTGGGWDLLTSADGFAWSAAPITGPFAAGEAFVALTTAGGELVAFELAPGLVMWRSADGAAWDRTDLGSPWPASAGLRIQANGVDVRRVGDLFQVTASISAIADWEALFGVPAELVAATAGTDGSRLGIRVTSGDREGRYDVELETGDRSVLLQVVDADDRVVGSQRLAPIDDPAEFVDLFVACGGFSPMHESWWVGLDGRLTAPPPWFTELGDHPAVAAGGGATFAIRQGRLLQLDGDVWVAATGPFERAEYFLGDGDRVLVAASEPGAGLTVWTYDGAWRLLSTPPGGAWPVDAAPYRNGAVLIYDDDGPQATAAVVGAAGRPRTYRLGAFQAAWGVTAAGDAAVVRTYRNNGDITLWAWRIGPAPTPRSTAV